MEAPSAAVALGALQLVVVVLLSADRWVHKVTGTASLETRVGTLELGLREVRKIASDTDDRVYKRLGEIQRVLNEMQLLQARQDEHFKATDGRVDALTRRIERFNGMS